MSSSSLPEAGAKLTLDLSEWESNWSIAIDQAVELQGTIDDLGGSVDIDINFTGDDALPFEEIPETIDTDLNVTEDKDTKSILDGINFLATIEKIKIAIDVVGTAINFVKDVGSMVVNPFLDVEDAVAKINAQTGGTGIEDLGQFIRDIQAADLGDSVDQISDVVIAAKQLGAPIDEATTAALTFTHTFKDENPVDVLTTLNSLVETGLVPNLQDAADLMTVAFQNSANKGHDLLNVVSANAQSWADMGLTGTQALSAINSLTQGNVDNATDAAKAIQTLDDALTTAADNASSPQAEALKTLGITNPKDSGQAMGADFIDGFAASFANLPANQQDLVSGVLFGKVGKKFTGALSELTTQGGPFSDVVGAASDAATEIDNSLRGAIDDFVTEINKRLGELLSSDAIDLPGKIEALKKGMQDALTVLQNGGTVGDALEIGLNIPGLSKTLDTFIGNFERIMGNLEIIFLQIVASIQDITGHGAEAAATRQTIASKSKTQLAFDLQLANSDEIPAMVSQALSRGLTTGDITTALETSVNESIAKADFSQGETIIQGAIAGAIADGATPEAANALAFSFTDKVSDAFDNAMAAGNLDLAQKIIAIPPNANVPGLDEFITSAQKKLSDAFAPQQGDVNAFNPFTQTFKGISDAFTTGVLAPGGGGKTGATGGGLLGGLKTDIKDFATAATEADTLTGVAFDHIQTAAEAVATSATTNMGTVGTAFDTAAVEADLADKGITLSLTGNTITASFEAVAASAAENFPAVIVWFNKTSAEAAAFDISMSGHMQHILNMFHDLQFLSAQVATGVQAALTLGGTLPPTPVATGAGAAGASQGITNNTIIVTNNVPNGAAAAANGYALGASLRGN